MYFNISHKTAVMWKIVKVWYLFRIFPRKRSPEILLKKDQVPFVISGFTPSGLCQYCNLVVFFILW